MTEKISDELLDQILDSDMGIGTAKQLGALVWQLADEVAESRSRIAELGAEVTDDDE